MRLTCLLRHFDVMHDLLHCAAVSLNHLMIVDSGCLYSDLLIHRYGCLCRRRARYYQLLGLPEPAIKGKLIEDVFLDTASMDYEDNNGTSTELQVSGTTHIKLTTGAP